MNRALADLQVFLNLKGADLKVDGLRGPKTRAAIIETFRNRTAPAITDHAIEIIAIRLGCTQRQLRAVARVEGSGAGWDKSGLLTCLWERHYLWRFIRIAIPFLSSPSPGGYTIDANGNGINDSWEKLADAALRWPGWAFECASFGKFQVMGANWRALGYAAARDFVWKLSRDETAHYEAFERYIKANGLEAALRRIDANPENARAFARGYNGPGYAKGDYHTKIAFAWKAERS